jgi:hypothetical protein
MEIRCRSDSVKQYEKIKEMLEELEDINAFDKAMNRKQQFSPEEA